MEQNGPKMKLLHINTNSSGPNCKTCQQEKSLVWYITNVFQDLLHILPFVSKKPWNYEKT